MTTAHDSYNGWANYETWAVSLHLNNDEGSQEMLLDLIREADDVHEAADRLAEWVTDYDDVATASGVYGDLLGHALSRVDWREIVDAEAGDMDDAYGADPGAEDEDAEATR